MKLLPNGNKKVELSSLDLELDSLYIDYEFSRRLGGKSIEITCTTFKNEAKRDALQGVLTNITPLQMIITKEERGISVKTNFSKDVTPFVNIEFEVSDAFVQQMIKLAYTNQGYLFEGDEPK
jgi:hypothetical protein